jgi:hypothetical protein
MQSASAAPPRQDPTEVTYVGQNPPGGSGAEHSDASPGGVAGLGLHAQFSDVPSAARVVPTPFGLVRIWESQGQTFVAETSTDGSLLGPALALDGARAASATVHRLETSFFLTVAWLSDGKAGGHADLLTKSWLLGRGALGLTLTAANDNPIIVGTGATEASVIALPGEELLFTWVDGDTGNVHGQVRAAQDGAQGPAFVMGRSAQDPGLLTRRISVLEVAPLEYAVLWLAANRRELDGVSLTKDVALGEESGGWASHPLPRVVLAGEAAGSLAITRGAAPGAIDVAYAAADANGMTAEMRQSIVLSPANSVDGGAATGVPKADDFGFLWASQDLLHLMPSALHAPGLAAPHVGPLVTRGDEPLLIDLAQQGAGHGVKIVAVDGAPLESDGPTRIAHGWLQARHDGHLTYTPDVDAMGEIRMHLSGLSETGMAWSRHLDIHVEGLYEAAHVELRNPVKTIPAHAVIAHHAQMAEIGIRGEAPPHGAVSLSGVDAEKFLVIGNGLFLRAGTRLEPARKALDVAVHFKDGLAGAAVAASLTIAVLNEPGALLSLALPGRAHAAEINPGQVVAELGVVEQAAGDRISLALLSNAGGRFALSGGNLVIASPQLFAHDPEASYDVVVRSAQPNGVAIDHKITLHHEDVLGRLPPAPEKPAAPLVEERAPLPPAASGEPVGIEKPAPIANAEAAPAERGEPSTQASEHPDDAGEAAALPPLHVEAAGHSAKGSSSQPDLGAGAGSAHPAEAEGLAKVLALQQRDNSGSDHGLRENRGSETSSGRDDDRVSKYEKDLLDALRHFGRGDDGNHGGRDDRGSDHGSELQKAQDAVSSDTLYFKPGFGKETIEHVKLSGGEAHDVLDLSLYGTTFEALRAAGAFEQVGNDVVLTLNPADPAHSDQIILKSIELHQIDPGDFKFS